MKYKLMCIDIDGTLFDSNKDLPEENKKAIQEAYKAGMKIAIASGRASASVREVLEDLGIRGYGICLNGAYIIDGNKEVSKYAFSDKQVGIIRKIVEKYDVRSFFATPILSVTNKPPFGGWLQAIQKSVAKQKELVICNNYELKNQLEDYRGFMLKVSIMEEDDRTYQKVREELEGANIFDVAKSDTHYIDVNVKGVNKSKGVKDLAQYLNIDLSEVICIGDNENDIEMIKVAGLGVAMSNSCEKLLEICDTVTLSNDEYGVAKVIYDYVLK
jgi:Cof subfamily protein (haloacid dehalogenase superfamily)